VEPAIIFRIDPLASAAFRSASIFARSSGEGFVLYRPIRASPGELIKQEPGFVCIVAELDRLGQSGFCCRKVGFSLVQQRVSELCVTSVELPFVLRRNERTEYRNRAFHAHFVGLPR
jgi:hypothetical protein